MPDEEALMDAKSFKLCVAHPTSVNYRAQQNKCKIIVRNAEAKWLQNLANRWLRPMENAPPPASFVCGSPGDSV